MGCVQSSSSPRGRALKAESSASNSELREKKRQVRRLRLRSSKRPRRSSPVHSVRTAGRGVCRRYWLQLNEGRESLRLEAAFPWKGPRNSEPRGLRRGELDLPISLRQATSRCFSRDFRQCSSHSLLQRQGCSLSTDGRRGGCCLWSVLVSAMEWQPRS